MRYGLALLVLLLLGIATADLQRSLTLEAPPEMWAAWAVDETLTGRAALSPSLTRVEDDNSLESGGSPSRRLSDLPMVPPEALALNASQHLERFRADALAHPLCTRWTCGSSIDAPVLSADRAQWAAERVLQPLREQTARDSAGLHDRLERNAVRAQGAPEILTRPLHMALGLALAGICLAWWRGAPAWPFPTVYAASVAAALAHETVALSSFELRHVQLNHLAVGAWALPAGLLGGVILSGLVSRHGLGDRLATAWLSIGPGASAWLRGALLLAVTSAWTWVPPLFGWRVLPAQQMEGLLALAAFVLATFVARNLAWTEATGRSTAFGWPLVLVGVLAGSAAALSRGDGGALALTLGLALVWLFVSCARALLVPAAFVVAVLWSAWLWLLPGLSEVAAPMPEALDVLVSLLPARIAERVAVAWTPFGAGPSDVSRLIGMVDLAGASGFGFDPPLEGLAAGREADRRLLQLTADYMPAVLVSVYGAPVATGIVALHFALLALLAWTGVRLCVGLNVSPSARLLALWGVFGLFGAVLRTMLSTGGTLGVLPLTGVPAPGLSLGTSAALATGLMAGLALAPAFWATKGETQ